MLENVGCGYIGPKIEKDEMSYFHCMLHYRLPPSYAVFCNCVMNAVSCFSSENFTSKILNNYFAVTVCVLKIPLI